MEKLIVGIIIGFIICAETGMVAFCVWYEKRFPESLGSSRRNHSGILETHTPPRYTSIVRHGAVDRSRERRLS